MSVRKLIVEAKVDYDILRYFAICGYDFEAPLKRQRCIKIMTGLVVPSFFVSLKPEKFLCLSPPGVHVSNYHRVVYII